MMRQTRVPTTEADQPGVAARLISHPARPSASYQRLVTTHEHRCPIDMALGPIRCCVKGT